MHLVAHGLPREEGPEREGEAGDLQSVQSEPFNLFTCMGLGTFHGVTLLSCQQGCGANAGYQGEEAAALACDALLGPASFHPAIIALAACKGGGRFFQLRGSPADKVWGKISLHAFAGGAMLGVCALYA